MYSTRAVNEYQVVNYDTHKARNYKTINGAKKAYNACKHGELRQAGNVIFDGRQEWFLISAK